MIPGKDGRDGRNGRDGARGPRGEPGPIGPVPKHEFRGTSIRFQKNNGDWSEWVDIVGPKGEIGKDGKSAYQVAVEQGFEGSVVEWLLSLKGKDGKDGRPGKDGKDGRTGKDGKDGRTGEDGLSAYEIWLAEGNEGTEDDFFNWLASKVKEKIKNSTQGGGPLRLRLGSLTDVNTSGATNGSFLKYENGIWSPGTGGSGAVDSVNGQTGDVVLDADDIDDSSTDNKFWQEGTGTTSVKIGFGSTDAFVKNCIAIGTDAIAGDDSDDPAGGPAESEGCVAIGERVQATARHCVAVGQEVIVTGLNSAAFGDDITVSGVKSYAMGDSITSSGDYMVVMGRSNSAGTATQSVEIGHQLTLTNGDASSILIGDAGSNRGSYNIGIGYDVHTGAPSGSQTGAIAIGRQAVAGNPSSGSKGTNSIAIGTSVNVNADGAVAIGNNINLSTDNVATFGDLPLILATIATSSLPSASSMAGAILYDTTANQVKYSNGSTWSALAGGGSGISNVVEDTTPQLGGSLDVNGQSIVSVSNGNIAITPNGTGKIILDGLSWPTADGTNGQVLKTDGSGNLSWVDDSGSGGGAVDSVNGATGVVVLDTGDISESGNLYFTDERAQDAIGGMVDSTLVYNDATPALGRAAISGDITIAAGSNTAAIASGVIVNADINASAAIDATKIANGSVSNTEFQYLDGVTSAIQTQFAGKVGSNTSGVSGADAITNMMSLTTAEYGAITPNATTLYFITDAT